MGERLFVRLADDAVNGPESGTPPGTLRSLEVDPRLRTIVSHVLAYEETIAPGEEIVERVLPDGALRLVFNLEAPRSVEVLGPSSRPAIVRLTGRNRGLSLTLRPGAAASLFGLPARELTHQTVDLDTLWKARARPLTEGLASARSDAERTEALWKALSAAMRELDTTGRRTALKALELIGSQRGAMRASIVAKTVGVGERRLQQLFAQHVGLTPRGWARLARLHAVLRELRRPRLPALATLALDGGYFDQAHLSNEFKALSGLTPTQFLDVSRSGSSKPAR